MKINLYGADKIYLNVWDFEEKDWTEKPMWSRNDGTKVEFFASGEDENFSEYKDISCKTERPVINNFNTTLHISYLLKNNKAVIVKDLDEEKEYEISDITIGKNKIWLTPLEFEGME